MSSGNSRRASSSSFGPDKTVDQKKRKRMISNRDSARRSRQKKQQHFDSLMTEAANLNFENRRLAMHIDLISSQFASVEMENAVLRAQLMELTDRLNSSNSVLHFIQDFSGTAIDIPQVPYPLLEPWQLPYPSSLLLASRNPFDF